MDTSGFYRWDDFDEMLYFGPNFVDGPYGSFSLRREDMDDRNNEINGSDVHGWFWFDTEAEATAALVPAPPPVEPEEP